MLVVSVWMMLLYIVPSLRCCIFPVQWENLCGHRSNIILTTSKLSRTPRIFIRALRTSEHDAFMEPKWLSAARDKDRFRSGGSGACGAFTFWAHTFQCVTSGGGMGRPVALMVSETELDALFFEARRASALEVDHCHYFNILCQK